MSVFNLLLSFVWLEMTLHECYCATEFAKLGPAHRIEDVNVNTASQCKGMCEAHIKPWGQSLKEEGRGGGRGRKIEQSAAKRAKRKFCNKNIG